MHSDLHFIKNDWGNAKYTVVPGHEVVEVITKVGENVPQFAIGDRVGMGCLAATCLKCEYCKNEQENYCENLQFVFDGIFWDDSIYYGGFSEFLVVDHRYVIRMPKNLPMAAVAPLLCAGITVYAPMKDNGLFESHGKSIGIVVGLGGLGHVAVKEKEAKEGLGAYDFILSTNIEQMQAGIFLFYSVIQFVGVIS